MNDAKENQSVAARMFRSDSLVYVSELPGQGGKDWGYSSSRQNAKLLSPYWVKRFLSDMRHVNDNTARVYPL